MGDADLVVNLQGDLPTLEPHLVARVPCAARRRRDRHRHARRRDPRARGAHQSQRGEGRRHALAAYAAPARALFHARQRAPMATARSIITSASTPTAARRCSASSACSRRRSSSARSSSSCVRSKPACASTSRSLTRFRSVSILPPTLSGHAASSRPPIHPQAEAPADLRPAASLLHHRTLIRSPCQTRPATNARRRNAAGTAECQSLRLRASPIRASRAPTRILPAAKPFPDLEAVACPTFEDALLAVKSRRSALRHDPDRELGRRPRRRHPSPAARGRSLHRRRALPARAPPADGVPGATSQHDQARR